MIFVTKFDGSEQPFDKQKIVRTCLRMHASPDQAQAVANKIEKKLYDGMPTKEIMRMIFSYLKEYRPEVKHEIDLRESISLLRPKPDFEHFIALLLSEYGYEVETNQIVMGKCVEHEIDIIARKDNSTIYIEIKHHFQSHTYTGVGILLEAKATFDDLKEGYLLRKNNYNFSRAMVVCNTKISDHGKRYADCSGIDYLGWKSPEEKGIESMILEKKFYPITFLKTLKRGELERLGNADILTLKQLVEMDVDKIRKKTGMSKSRILLILRAAREVLQA